MKKLKCAFAAMLIGLTACLCGACSTEEQPSVTVTQNTQTFITIVSQIQDSVTVDDGLKIEAALLVYDYLNDAEKSNADVSASKARLDGLKADYDVVKAKADEQVEIARENKRASAFITEVNGLPLLDRLRLEDKETVDGLIVKYNELKAESKQRSDVNTAYGKLLDAQDKIAELEEAAHQELVEATAKKFINAVEEILESIEKADDESKDETVLSAGVTISYLLEDYNGFEEDVTAYEGVAEAKAKLDDLYAECQELQDAKDVEEFKELVESLKPVEATVTLQSKDTITTAEGIYKYMSDTAKAAEGVAEAYEVLQQAREKYDELFTAAENERIAIFIAAANKVRTNIEDVDILWFDELDAASRAFDALTYDTQVSLKGTEAYERWNAAQKAFDRKGYQRIPMSEPTLVYSGDVPPHIVLQNHANMLNPIIDLYNLSSYTEISTYAKVWLNVYVDGNYIACGEVDTAKFIDNGHIIPGSEVVKVLQQLSDDYSEIRSGANFGFALSIEDRENKYIPSAQTKVSQTKVYNW